jgi:hypothetical protein
VPSKLAPAENALLAILGLERIRVKKHKGHFRAQPKTGLSQPIGSTSISAGSLTGIEVVSTEGSKMALAVFVTCEPRSVVVIDPQESNPTLIFEALLETLESYAKPS